MKIFDCNICKNKQNNLRYCVFFSEEPEVDVCYGFSKKEENNENKRQDIDKIIKQKALSLTNNFQDIGFTFDDWFNIIKHSIYNNKAKDIISFIKGFGNDGFIFACDSCGNAVELEDDTNYRCQDCNKKELNFISVIN